jgi:hypothetical protein
MHPQLPEAIAVYMESINTNNNAVLDSCMSKDAHVHDVGENNHINGLDDIKKWRGDSNHEFELLTEVRDVEEKYGIYIITAIAKGDFPGSPQRFYYFFTMTNDLITNIEIVPGAENVTE